MGRTLCQIPCLCPTLLEIRVKNYDNPVEEENREDDDDAEDEVPDPENAEVGVIRVLWVPWVLRVFRVLKVLRVMRVLTRQIVDVHITKEQSFGSGLYPYI